MCRTGVLAICSASSPRGQPGPVDGSTSSNAASRKGRFETPSSRLSAYAMLRMGDVSLWFRADGPLSESEVAYYYGDMALRLVLARTAGTQAQATTPSPAHA